jgi:hypothetical protein
MSRIKWQGTSNNLPGKASNYNLGAFLLNYVKGIIKLNFNHTFAILTINLNIY